jgi:ribosome-binding protein aMBF1 (putative translation factor)
MIHIWWNQRKKRMNNTSDALKIIRRSIDKDPELLAMLKDSSVNAQVSMIIYDVRKQAGLTQRQLADLVGTTQSVIARLEDADYDGHSLSMLARIASALGQKLEIKMSPKEVA